MADKWSSGPTYGIVTDTSPYELDPGKWSLGYNLSFKNGKTSQRGGSERVLWGYTTTLHDLTPNNIGNGTVTGITTTSNTVAEVITLTCTAAAANSGTFSVSGSVSGAMGNATVGTTFSNSKIAFTISDGGTDYSVGDNFTITTTLNKPVATPKFMLPWSIPTADYWVWATNTAAYRWDGSTHSVITRAAGAYTATDTNQWTGCVSGDVVFLNNAEDLPQYIGSSGTLLQNFPTGGSDWPVNLRCKSLRAFKNYLVAINLSEGASLRPQSIRWSTAADPGSIPQWDITDPTLEAGETSLAETNGAVLDGLALGDSFFLYKEDAVYSMQLVGGQYVMQISKVFGDDGILGVNCVTQFMGQHFVASKNDVYIHNGTTKRSILSGKNREAWGQVIDRSKLHRCYCVTDYRNRESLFCFVLSNTGAAYPNHALVYNWENDSLSIRTLPTSPFATFGSVVSASPVGTDWSQDVDNWDDDVSVWDDSGLSQNDDRLVMIDSSSNYFWAEGDYPDDAGTTIQSIAYRDGIDCGDHETIKFVSAIYPHFSGVGTVNVSIGAQDIPYGTIRWSGPYAFTIGTSRKLDCRVSGRYLALRVDGTGASSWSLYNYTLEGSGVGDGESA